MDARLSDAVFAAPAAPTLGGPGPLLPVPAAPKPRTARVRVTSEVVGVRGALGGYYRSLPPFIDDLTREYGPDLYDRMQLDDQVSSSLRALCHGVLSDELVLRPGVDDKDDPDFAAAKDALGFCERATWQQTGGLDRWLLTMLKGAVGGGNRVSETVYRPEESGKDAGRWVLDRLKVKPRRSIAFAVDSCNNLSGFLGLAPDGPGWGALAWGTAFDPADPPDNFIPRDKFCALAWDPPDEDPRGSALLRCVYEPWWAKLQAARDWLAYLAQFGSPSLVGTTAPGADSSAPTDAYGNPVPGDVLTPEQDMANRVLEFRNGGVFILPSGATLEILQTSNAGDAFLKKVDSSDRAIAQGILLAMRAVMQSRFGSRADAEQGQDVAGLQTRFMKRWLARMVTEDLLRPLVRINLGPDAARRLCPYASLSPVEHQDLGASLVAVSGAWKNGLIKNSQLPWVYEQFGMPPATEEEMAAPPPQPPAAPGATPPGAAPAAGGPPAPPQAPFAWDESKHPRGQPENRGEFGPGGGGAAPPVVASGTAPAAPGRSRPAKPEYRRELEKVARSRERLDAEQLGTRLQEMAFTPAQDHLLNVFFGSADGFPGLSAGEKRSHVYALYRVVGRMPEKAVRRLAANVRRVVALKDAHEGTREYLKAAGRLPKDVDSVLGFYDPGAGSVYSDGGAEHGARGGDPEDTQRGVWSHELTHAIDGPGFKLSGHPDWQAAFEAELAGGALSDYGATSALEGFAEFGRAAYGADVPLATVERLFPRCTAYFRRRGLV